MYGFMAISPYVGRGFEEGRWFGKRAGEGAEDSVEDVAPFGGTVPALSGVKTG